ncbi:MAG: carboxypeptidase regulatory-like domain-containing protein [Planctomycetes bacterium]|nr:carboxypeptidase regulatory-like domain-containing protein [Planctomycetota bacterium]
MTRHRLAIAAVTALAVGVTLLVAVWPRRPGERIADAPSESAATSDATSISTSKLADSHRDVAPLATPIDEPAPKSKGSTVVGRVVRSVDRSPLGEVGVEIVAWEVPPPSLRIRPIRRTTSAADGTFRFEGVDLHDRRPMSMRVRDRYWWGTGSILAQAKRTDDGVDVGDLPATTCGTVSGRCVSPDGRALEGVELLACPFVDPNAPPNSGWDVNGEDTFLTRATSDSDGRFVIGANVPGPKFEVRSQRGAFAPARSEPFVAVAESDVSIGDLTLPVGGGIVAHMRDAAGRPVPGASLQANRKLAAGNKPEILPGPAIETAGDDGTVRIAHLSPAHYFVIAGAEKLAGVTIVDVVVEEGATPTPLEIVLAAGHFVAGRVTDAGGAPVSGATIRAHPEGSNGFLDRAKDTDAQGRFRIEGLSETKVDLNLRAEGWVSQSKSSVEVDHDDVDFVLVAKGTIRGRVIGPDGAPVANARVWAHAKDQAPSDAGPARSSDDGTFELSVRPAAYVLFADHADFAESESVAVDITDGKPIADVTVTLRAGATIRGIVLASADRTPIPHALVIAAPSAATPEPPSTGATEHWNKRAVSQLDGSFTLRGVSPGTCEIRAQLEPWIDGASAPIEIAEGAAVDGVVILLRRGATIHGTVYDDGQPSGGVPVNLFDGPRHLQETKSRDDGTYAIERIPPGAYQIMRMPKEILGDSGTIESVPVTLREGDDVVIDLGEKASSASAGCRVFGSVLAGGQALVAQVVMVKVGAGGFHAAQAKSDENGNYEFIGVASGRYRVLVQPGEDVGNFSATIDIPERREWRVDLSAPEGIVSGHVVDADTGKPIGGIAVLALRTDARANVDVETFVDVLSGKVDTDGDGEYRLRHVAPGRYRIEAGAFTMDGPVEGSTDCAVESLEVTVGVDGPVTADFRLRRGATLEGNVRDASGAPVSAAVRVEEDPRRPTFNSLVGIPSSDHGHYVVHGLHAGEHMVTVTSKTHAPVRRRVRIGAGTTHEDFVVASGGALRVTVVTSHGDGVPDAVVELRDSNGDLVPTSTGALDLLGGVPQAASGSVCNFPHLVPGTYSVRAWKPTVGSGTATAHVADGVETSVRVEVR